MKKIILILAILLSDTKLFAQEIEDSSSSVPKNNISLNYLGEASIFSLNYERLFFINSELFLTAQAGIGYNKTNLFLTNVGGPKSLPETEKCLTIPHHITANFGNGKNFFEFGLGGTMVNGNTNQHYLLYPIIGYRRQPSEAALFDFRIFVNLPLQSSDLLAMPFGISIGACF